MTTTYEYGTKVIEFNKHSDEELQELIDKAEARYYSNVQGLHYKDLAAYIEFIQYKPLEQSLIEMQALIQEGYTIHRADYSALLFKCTLRKTDAMIAAELPKLTELAKAEYEELRYAFNVAETAKQMEYTIARRAREQAEAKAAAEAKHKTDEEAFALADLLKAYTPKPKAKAKQEVAA
jgi:hypothetical protein